MDLPGFHQFGLYTVRLETRGLDEEEDRENKVINSDFFG